MESVRLLVLAEEWLLAHGVASLLGRRFDAHAVESFDRAVRLLDEDRPQLALWIGDRIDVETVERLKALRRFHDSLRMCVVTRAADCDALRALLEHETNGVAVLRRMDRLEAGELLATLDDVLAGRSTVEPRMLEDLLRAGEDDVLRVLTAQEQEVLELVAYGLRNCEIASRLWKSEKAVEKQVSRIMRKLGLDGHRSPHLDRRVMAARIFFRSRPERVRSGEPPVPMPR